jgi:hypothetical protein
MSKRFAVVAVLLAIIVSIASACVVILQAPTEPSHMRNLVIA